MEEPMTARISCPAKTATQSGFAKSRRWLLEFDRNSPREIDPLMGWTSSSDMNAQVRLWFPTKEEAIAYAEREGLAYVVIEPNAVTRKILSYSDNFRTTRIGQWTH